MFTLHAHSNYSLLQSTIKIDELVGFAKKSNSTYVALTDTNAMYGLIQFLKTAKENNIKPILGALIDDPKEKDLSAVFIARNNDGYSHLCRIITTRKLKDDFSLPNLFKEPLNDLFILTSSISLLKQMQIDLSLRQNLFVELIVTEKQKNNTRVLYDFAKANHLKIVATHPAYFLSPEDFLLHKVVSAVRSNSTLANLESADIIDEEFYLKSPAELSLTWKGLPEALWNADKIAQECNVDLKIGEYKFPTFSVQLNDSAFSSLWKISFEGLTRRYDKITEQAIKRLNYELEVIEELGFSDYFLIVWDIIREAKSRGIIHIGRGSAANSLVSYCLGFTEVDPVKHNLYFERFLNRGRLSPPDVDLDFSWKERDSIIKYVFEKYGYDRVGMISTTVTFRARSAFREVAKAFGIPDSEISKYSKFIPWTSAHNLPNIAEKFPETRSLDFKNEPWKTIVNLASRLAGFPRHLSIHPSGIIITKEKITNYVAMEYAKNKGLGLVITQPDMYSTEELGLIKIDLLSQRSLGVLKLTMNELNKISASKNNTGDISIPIYNISLH
ncbi:MAG: PHP domain-containing protein [Ignavibacteriales bacterium]|nr:PHP domain-containing protein [Ignavibacteriales bacterium]